MVSMHTALQSKCALGQRQRPHLGRPPRLDSRRERWRPGVDAGRARAGVGLEESVSQSLSTFEVRLLLDAAAAPRPAAPFAVAATRGAPAARRAAGARGIPRNTRSVPKRGLVRLARLRARVVPVVRLPRPAGLVLTDAVPHGLLRSLGAVRGA